MNVKFIQKLAVEAPGTFTQLSFLVIIITTIRIAICVKPVDSLKYNLSW